MAELITSTELAEMLGVTYQTVYNWRNKKYGPKPVFLSSRSIRYRLEDVETWMKDNEGFETNGDN